tara:strand:+ start:5010 stop:7958 length:2949 start_codon:yes stop_codon:yes gene_type:complete
MSERRRGYDLQELAVVSAINQIDSKKKKKSKKKSKKVKSKGKLKKVLGRGKPPPIIPMRYNPRLDRVKTSSRQQRQEPQSRRVEGRDLRGMDSYEQTNQANKRYGQSRGGKVVLSSAVDKGDIGTKAFQIEQATQVVEDLLRRGGFSGAEVSRRLGTGSARVRSGVSDAVESLIGASDRESQRDAYSSIGGGRGGADDTRSISATSILDTLQQADKRAVRENQDAERDAEIKDKTDELTNKILKADALEERLQAIIEASDFGSSIAESQLPTISEPSIAGGSVRSSAEAQQRQTRELEDARTRTIQARRRTAKIEANIGRQTTSEGLERAFHPARTTLEQLAMSDSSSELIRLEALRSIGKLGARYETTKAGLLKKIEAEAQIEADETTATFPPEAVEQGIVPPFTKEDILDKKQFEAEELASKKGTTPIIDDFLDNRFTRLTDFLTEINGKDYSKITEASAQQYPLLENTRNRFDIDGRIGATTTFDIFKTASKVALQDYIRYKELPIPLAQTKQELADGIFEEAFGRQDRQIPRGVAKAIADFLGQDGKEYSIDSIGKLYQIEVNRLAPSKIKTLNEIIMKGGLADNRLEKEAFPVAKLASQELRTGNPKDYDKRKAEYTYGEFVGHKAIILQEKNEKERTAARVLMDFIRGFRKGTSQSENSTRIGMSISSIMDTYDIDKAENPRKPRTAPLTEANQQKLNNKLRMLSNAEKQLKKQKKYTIKEKNRIKQARKRAEEEAILANDKELGFLTPLAEPTALAESEGAIDSGAGVGEYLDSEAEEFRLKQAKKKLAKKTKGGKSAPKKAEVVNRELGNFSSKNPSISRTDEVPPSDELPNLRGISIGGVFHKGAKVVSKSAQQLEKQKEKQDKLDREEAMILSIAEEQVNKDKQLADMAKKKSSKRLTIREQQELIEREAKEAEREAKLEQKRLDKKAEREEREERPEDKEGSELESDEGEYEDEGGYEDEDSDASFSDFDD